MAKHKRRLRRKWAESGFADRVPRYKISLAKLHQYTSGMLKGAQTEQTLSAPRQALHLKRKALAFRSRHLGPDVIHLQMRRGRCP
jgi:hypothetical protein